MHRRELELSFSQRIKEVEDRFSDDQESVAKRFQADVLQLEQHYQGELEALSGRHAEQKLQWEAQVQKAQEEAEEQRRTMEETMDQEREKLEQQWLEERTELEGLHAEKVEGLGVKNQQLQKDLDDFISSAQTKEIELSRQLNDLHSRLQESLETRDQILAQSEQKALETEQLLHQALEDFRLERTELLSQQTELEAKNNEMVSISEKQITERIELLTECDDLKVKIEELEMLLRRAAEDFKLERKELQERIIILEKKLEDNAESVGEDLMAEREKLQIRIMELEMELNQLMTSMEMEKEEEMDELTALSEARLVEPTNIELLSVSPPLVEENITEEVMMEAVDAVDGEKAENVDAECDEKAQESSQELDQINQEPTPDSDQEEEVDDATESNKQMECCSAQISQENPECDSPAAAPAGDHTDAEPGEEAVSLQASEGDENEAAAASCEEDNKPQAAPAWDSEGSSHGDEPHHEAVVELDQTPPAEDPELTDLPDLSHDHSEDVELVSDSDCEDLTAEMPEESLDKDAEWEERDGSLLKIEALYNKAAEENVLLLEQRDLLMQKSEILENLLAQNSEKIKTSHQIFDENYGLKVKMLLLMEHIKELEMKAIKTTDLEIRYDDCVCENTKLREQNDELEKRLWNLETRMNILHDLHDQQMSLVDEIGKMREENVKLSGLFGGREKQWEESLEPLEEPGPELGEQPELSDQEAEERCEKFEQQNTDLRRAITELQDSSKTLNEATQAHR